MADGLPEPGCASVTIGSRGKVLIRHLSQPFVSHLDGYSISTIPAPETNARRVYESPAGQLWMPARKGLLEFKGDSWELHAIAQIANCFAANPQRLLQTPIRPVRQGQVLFLLPDALMVFNARSTLRPQTELLMSSAATRLGEFSGLSLARDGGLWVCGSNGFAKIPGPVRNLSADASWQEHLPPAALDLVGFRDLWEFEDGSVTVLAEVARSGQKVIVSFDGQWLVEPVVPEKVRYAWRSPDKGFWAVTESSLYQWESGSEVIESEDIAARQYFDVAIEPSGAFWLATSDGLYRYAPPSWRKPRAIQHVDSLVHCVSGDRQDRLWFITGSGLHMLQNDTYRDFPFPPGMARRGPPPRQLWPLPNGSLLMEEGGRLSQFDPAAATFRPALRSPHDGRILGRWKDGLICLQRRGDPGPDPQAGLVLYDGEQFLPFLQVPGDPALGTNFTSLFVASNGDAWLGTELGIAWFHEDRWRVFAAADGSDPAAPIGFIELSDGKIWCAAQDRIWEFDGRTWTELQRTFERVNALVRTRDGSVWVASNTGCYRYFQGTWVENGVQEGLGGEGTRDLFEDQRGRVWAGTTHGLSVYHPEADPDPPKADIQELREPEREIEQGAAVTLSFTGIDKWKFTSRDRLLFSYRLDQGEWSEFVDANHMTFTDLSAGKHYFQVRAMDRNCNVDPRPARLEFAIVLPWYKETRLVLILSLGMGAALFFAALAFNRHRQLLRSYAEVERTITQRTKELETANRELLQSQKMTALGTLAAGIAHDFNNILSIIKGSAQIIEENVQDAGKIRTRVDRIKTVVEQGSGIVKAMLGFSRDSSEQTGLCDVNAVVEDTIRLLGDRFLREVKVLSRPGSALPQLVTSKDLIQQILLNFIFNAAESMAKRKEIIIATRQINQLPPELVLVPGSSIQYVEISVQDFGSGIAPQTLPRIFEPFFTTKALSARRGTGLGLSMVYELAKKLEAGLAVDTTLNEGSTFYLILPVRGVMENAAGTISP